MPSLSPATSLSGFPAVFVLPVAGDRALWKSLLRRLHAHRQVREEEVKQLTCVGEECNGASELQADRYQSLGGVERLLIFNVDLYF